MSTKSTIAFGQRAEAHGHLLAKKLLQIAESKKTNVIVSADLTSTQELLKLADGEIEPILNPNVPCIDCL